MLYNDILLTLVLFSFSHRGLRRASFHKPTVVFFWNHFSTSNLADYQVTKNSMPSQCTIPVEIFAWICICGYLWLEFSMMSWDAGDLGIAPSLIVLRFYFWVLYKIIRSSTVSQPLGWWEATWAPHLSRNCGLSSGACYSTKVDETMVHNLNGYVPVIHYIRNDIST